MPDPVLVIGGDGMVGQHLTRHLLTRGDMVLSTTRRADLAAPDRPLLDLSAADRLRLPPVRPRVAVLVAAVARLGDCRADPDGSARVNEAAPATLARILAEQDIPLVFLSTDKVFDGSVPDRAAADEPCPTSIYGRQKAAAEAAVLGHPLHAVLRLSRVIPPADPLLASWAFSLGQGLPIAPFTDLRMAPVPVTLVARVIAGIIDTLSETPGRGAGLWQLSGSRDVTYADAASRLAERLGVAADLVRPVAGVAGTEPPARFTTLDSRRLAEAFGVSRPDPDTVLDAVFATLD